MMNLPPREIRQVYTMRDTILYALGVGAALGSPTDPDEMRFVYEKDQEVLPTMAVVLGSAGFWLKDPQLGVDWTRILHGEQSIQLHRPLAVAADVTGVTTVDAIYDKGPDKGALLYSSRKISDTATGEPIATVRMSSFLRGDGGFGGSSEGAPQPHSIPGRSPDVVLDLPTRPEQGLIYRLSGDFNPLHADPAVAKAAGFPMPILHGLCTYGVAGRAVVKALCSGSPAQLERFEVRFSSPVFPGETLRVEMWREGAGRASLRARVIERDVVVLQNGLIEYEV
jgi:acyl dehydratase